MKLLKTIAFAIGLAAGVTALCNSRADAQESGCLNCHKGIEQFTDGPMQEGVGQRVAQRDERIDAVVQRQQQASAGRQQ